MGCVAEEKRKLLRFILQKHEKAVLRKRGRPEKRPKIPCGTEFSLVLHWWFKNKGAPSLRRYVSKLTQETFQIPEIKGGNVPNTCIECGRLQNEFNDALRSHTKKLSRIFDARNDQDSDLLLKLEPGALVAGRLRDITRQALATHEASHNKKEMD
jgi:hypothetical protein